MAKHSVEQGGLGNQAVGVGGIDVAKDWHYVQWLDTNGRPVGKAFRFANTRAGFEAMWDRRPCDAVRIGMESTGRYWLGLAHWLRAQGAEVVLVQPAHVHRLKELDDNTPTKTDAKDARVIARLVFDDRWFRWEPRAGALAQLATLAVTRRQHHQDVMRCRSRIAGWLHQYFPEFLTVFKAWDGKAALTALDTLPTPDLVLAQSVDTLTDQFRAASKNRVGAKRAHALHQAAVDSIGIPEGRATARLQLASYLRSWRAALAAQMAIEAEQATMLADLVPAEPLYSIHGFGPQVIAALRGELGDSSRFADPRQAQNMTGLNLTQISSGHHQGQTHAYCRTGAARGARRAVSSRVRRGGQGPLACMTHGQAYDAHRLFATTEVVVAA